MELQDENREFLNSLAPEQLQRRNVFIQSQVSDILNLVANHNVKMATPSPMLGAVKHHQGETSIDVMERIVKVTNKYFSKPELMNELFDADKKSKNRSLITIEELMLTV